MSDNVVRGLRNGVRLEDMLKLGIPESKGVLREVAQIGILCEKTNSGISPSGYLNLVYVSGILTKKDKHYLICGPSYDTEDGVISTQRSVELTQIDSYEKVKDAPFETIR